MSRPHLDFEISKVSGVTIGEPVKSTRLFDGTIDCGPLSSLRFAYRCLERLVCVC
jgi:hypothetical protein